jgi:SPP1 gp7 family putative phage head morphogenesis protein
MVGRRWEAMRDTLAEDMHNVNDIARSIVYGHLPEVYALNHNYSTFEIETKAMLDTSYTLYDRQTVERLIGENPDLLPPPAPNSKVARAIAKNKDLRWNQKRIQSELLQGILQGESIVELARRMMNVTGSNYSNSVRYARTMFTGAENAGRVEAYKRAAKMGIEYEQQWVATLDGRTRHSHRQLDGERIKVGGTFSNGCRFPGDPQGKPSEVYNCRCTLISQMVGLEHDLSGRSLVKLDGKSYEEWKQGHYKKK